MGTDVEGWVVVMLCRRFSVRIRMRYGIRGRSNEKEKGKERKGKEKEIILESKLVIETQWTGVTGTGTWNLKLN